MDWKERIERKPGVMVGKPVIKGTRITVELILELMTAGWSEEEILRNYPGIGKDDIRACLAFALESIQTEAQPAG